MMTAILKRISLSQWIMLAMVFGILLGWLLPQTAIHLQVVSTIFLNLIKCIIVPLIFGTLVVGIAGHTEDMRAVGRLALRSIIYFEIVTTLALVIGLGAVNFVQPGAGIRLDASKEAGENYASKKVSFEGVV